jgi:hypothetical protein
VAQVPEGRKLFAHLTVEENLLCGAATRGDRAAIHEDIGRIYELFSERFLVRRPLLQAIAHGSGPPPVLLIDEIDRADDEFEAFLLEILSDYSVTIPELGTFHADVPPVVVITSNRTRDVHDALKRRCLYHWVDHPDFAREVAIVRLRAPEVSEQLASLRDLGHPGADSFTTGQRLEVAAVEGDRPGDDATSVQRQQAGDRPDERGLAGAVGAEESEDGTLRHGELHPMEDFHALHPETRSEFLNHLLDLENRGHSLTPIQKPGHGESTSRFDLQLKARARRPRDPGSENPADGSAPSMTEAPARRASRLCGSSASMPGTT